MGIATAPSGGINLTDTEVSNDKVDINKRIA